VTGTGPGQPRDYGGWRRRRGIGLLGLGATGTTVVLAMLLVLAVVAAVYPAGLAVTVPLVVIAGAAGLAPAGGQPLALLAVQRWRWRHAERREHTAFRAGVVAAHSPHWQLPGVLAPLALLDCEDGAGGRYGIVADARTGLMTATLRVAPSSWWLADQADADAWVAGWGGWLASLGRLPACRRVTVTIDTAPEPGTALADMVAATLHPQAPLTARQIITQVAAAAHTAAADVATLVSITFDPALSPAAPEGLTAAAAEVGQALPGLEAALAACGVTVLGRASAAEIAAIVRAASDPGSRGQVRRVLARAAVGEPAEGLSWQDAAPAGAQEHPGWYDHDGGTSVTWAWREAPRQAVTADVLTPLLSPGPFPRRVSLQYRPLPAAEAARVLEAQVSAASFRSAYRHRTGRDETARDAADQARARQAAAEEAAGAGACLVSLYVTVTVTDPADLPRAVADTEAAAEASRIRLRRMTYSQAAGWATTLPCGICPQDLARRARH
jgi:hypothetical protein